MVEWIAQWWLALIFSALASAIVVQWKQLRAYKKGLVALLRNQIISDYNKYIEKEYVPIYAMEAITHAYNSYVALGGNGCVKKLYEELLDMPSHTPDHHHHLPCREGGNTCLQNIQDRTSL